MRDSRRNERTRETPAWSTAKYPRPAPREATAADIVRWIERCCYVPEGKLLGRPFRLAPFQIEALEAVFDNPAGTRRGIFSWPRKQGKTTFSACLLLNYLVGPKARPNSQLYSTAMSREQAALLFSAAAKMVRLSPALRDHITVKDSAKELVCPELGTKYRALSADASTAYGLSPTFCVHDELGQVRGPRSQLYEALETATGAVENPLSLVISTQAANDTDLLSQLIDDALTGSRPARSHPVVHGADLSRPVRRGNYRTRQPGARRVHEPGRGLEHGGRCAAYAGTRSRVSQSRFESKGRGFQSVRATGRVEALRRRGRGHPRL